MSYYLIPSNLSKSEIGSYPLGGSTAIGTPTRTASAQDPTANQTSYTFSSLNLGSETGTKTLVVCIGKRSAVGNISTLSSVTIAGNNCEIINLRSIAGSNSLDIAGGIAYVEVNGVTSGDVVVNLNELHDGAAIVIYEITGSAELSSTFRLEGESAYNTNNLNEDFGFLFPDITGSKEVMCFIQQDAAGAATNVVGVTEDHSLTFGVNGDDGLQCAIGEDTVFGAYGSLDWKGASYCGAGLQFVPTGQAVRAPRLVYSNSLDGSHTSQTINDDLGHAGSRKYAALIAYRHGGGTLTNVTIGGVTATLYKQASTNSNIGIQTAIAVATISDSVAPNLVFSYDGGSHSWLNVALFEITGISVLDSAGDNGALSLSTSLSGPVGSLVFGIAASNTSEPTLSSGFYLAMSASNWSVANDGFSIFFGESTANPQTVSATFDGSNQAQYSVLNAVLLG